MEEENINNFQESFKRSSKPVNDINCRLRDNEIEFQHRENFISCKNTEIRKLQSNTKIIDLASSAMEKRSKLVDQTLNELDFSLDISQKCSEEKISLQIMLQEKINSRRNEMKLIQMEIKKKSNRYLEEYNNILQMYESYHPQFNQVKKLKIKDLKLEVELKIINKRISNIIEEKATRKEFIKLITQVNITKFASSVLELQKSKTLKAKLEEAQKVEEELVKELELLDLKQNQMIETQLRAPAEMPNLEFYQPRLVEDIIAPACKSNIPPKASFSIANSRLNCENFLSGINSRCYQRQQQWDKLIPQKRPLIENSDETRPPPCKQRKLPQPIIKAFQSVVIPKATENQQRVQFQPPVVVEKNNLIEKPIQIEKKFAEPRISEYFNKKSSDIAVSSTRKNDVLTSSPVHSFNDSAMQQKQQPRKMDIVTSSPVHSFNDSATQQKQQEEMSYNNEESECGLMDFSLSLSMEEGPEESSLMQIGNSEPENPFTFNFKSTYTNGNGGGLSKFF